MFMKENDPKKTEKAAKGYEAEKAWKVLHI